MKPLRVVLLMVEPPLPFGNAVARWYYVLLKGLVARGHHVTAFSTCSNAADIGRARELFPAGAYDLRCYPEPTDRGVFRKVQTLRRPYSYMFSPELSASLRAETERGFDVLHLEQLWSGWLGLAHRRRALVNVHHLIWIDLALRRPATWREWLDRRLRFRAERHLVRQLQFFRASSPRLVEPMRHVNQQADITTVPVGLDPSLYPYISGARRPERPVVSLIGSMAWYPGYSAAVRLLERVWPGIKRQVPDVRLEIVGWAARTELAQYVDLADVDIYENVADTRPFFERASALVYAPGRGSGMKVKILEAMALGVPVVTTSEGVEGLPAEDGVHAGISEEDDGLVERTVRLLLDRNAQERQRAAARAMIESHCGPVPTLDAIEAIYARMMSAGR